MSTFENISSGAANLVAIENQLFDVLTLPLYPPTLEVIKSENDIHPKASFKRPNTFGNYKHTGGDCLGVLGKDFRATQPRALFQSFVECLTELDNIDFSKMRYTELKGGAKVRFTIPLQGFGFKNKARKIDDIETFISLETGFDGYTKTTYTLDTRRLVCLNGMTVKDSSVNVSFKNTKGNVDTIKLACHQLTAVAENGKKFQERVAAYNNREVSKKEVNAYVKGILGYSPEDREELYSTKIARLDQLMEAIDLEFSRTGTTVWGLLNGVTYATNHVFETKNRTDYLFAGAGYRTNAKAQVLANELIK